MHVLCVTAVVLNILLTCEADTYLEKRKKLIDLEESQHLGSKIHFSEKEREANRNFMAVKLLEFEAGFNDSSKFLPAEHFFRSRRDVEASGVFRILRKLPKGAALHSHFSAMVSAEYLLNNVTYRDDLYVCFKKGKLKFKFMLNGRQNAECDWQLLRDLRRRNSSMSDVVRRGLSMVREDGTIYSTVEEAWAKFSDIFGAVSGLRKFKPVFVDMVYQVLKDLWEDNVMYAEIRHGFSSSLYELDGTELPPENTVEIFVESVERFKRDHPDFVGVKVIFAEIRTNFELPQNWGPTLKLVRMWQEKYEPYFAGFDLVGYENLYPLLPGIEELKTMNVSLFLHAGETNWFGTHVDLNLVDAALLPVKRIGHGFALLKHPEVLKLVKERGIAIEVNPISSQVLKLVVDMRNHPGAVLMAEDYPVVISNDDPGFWGATGLSSDWYMAFMGMASKDADLRFLKQLAMNSITYSSLSFDEKELFMKKWLKKWDTFIDNMQLYINESAKGSTGGKRAGSKKVSTPGPHKFRMFFSKIISYFV